MSDIASILSGEFPHGHSGFIPLTLKEIELHSDKNYDYAHGGDPLGNFQRVGELLRLYPGLQVSDQRVVALIYLLKQLDQVLWSLSRGHEGKLEGLIPRLLDVSVYAKLIALMTEDMDG